LDEAEFDYDIELKLSRPRSCYLSQITYRKRGLGIFRYHAKTEFSNYFITPGKTIKDCYNSVTKDSLIYNFRKAKGS
jgi:hypothetical protein